MEICCRMSVQKVGLLKVESVQRSNSVNFLDRLIEIVEEALRVLFGVLGSREFTIEGFDYDNDAEVWDVTLTRRINRKQLTYRMTIDNITGDVISFHRR